MTDAAPLRVVVLGMPCGFTRDVLAAAMASNAGDRVFDVRAIVLASEVRESGSAECDGNDWPPGVPFRRVTSRSAFTAREFQEHLVSLAPDVIVVACFPWRIPETIRTIPRFGCLNVHPSLLPEGRGPEPVFWAFRRGMRQTGVTVHLMDDGFDTGPILAQDVVDFDADATITSLEADLARRGGILLHAVLRDLGQGAIRERAQPSGNWVAAPFPSGSDLVATTQWSTSHVASFVRGVAPVHGPVPVLIVATGQHLPRPVGPGDVLTVDESATQVDPVIWEGDTVRVRCSPGVVTLRMPRRVTPMLIGHAVPRASP